MGDLGIPRVDVVLMRVEEIGLGVTRDSDQGRLRGHHRPGRLERLLLRAWQS